MTIEQLTYIVATSKSKTAIKNELKMKYNFEAYRVNALRDGLVEVSHLTRCRVRQISDKSFDALEVFMFKKNTTGAVFNGAYTLVTIPKYILTYNGRLKYIRGTNLKFPCSGLQPRTNVSEIKRFVNLQQVEMTYYQFLEQSLRMIDMRDVNLIAQRSGGNQYAFYKGLDRLRNKIDNNGIKFVSKNGMYKKMNRTGVRV